MMTAADMKSEISRLRPMLDGRLSDPADIELLRAMDRLLPTSRPETLAGILYTLKRLRARCARGRIRAAPIAARRGGMR